MADFLFAALFAWITPLETALSNDLEASLNSVFIFVASPEATASRNLRIAVLSAER
jgi:hypothetical protein